MTPLVTGIICLWHGPIVSIPGGWLLCDGTNGTPDLRDKFIIGAGSTYNPDDSGGNVTHDHTFTGDGHNHTIAAGTQIATGIGFNATSGGAAATGTTAEKNHLPPYYSLAYIMKS